MTPKRQIGSSDCRRSRTSKRPTHDVGTARSIWARQRIHVSDPRVAAVDSSVRKARVSLKSAR